MLSDEEQSNVISVQKIAVRIRPLRNDETGRILHSVDDQFSRTQIPSSPFTREVAFLNWKEQTLDARHTTGIKENYTYPLLIADKYRSQIRIVLQQPPDSGTHKCKFSRFPFGKGKCQRYTKVLPSRKLACESAISDHQRDSTTDLEESGRQKLQNWVTKERNWVSVENDKEMERITAD
ncbi:hypothetical protein RUM44_010711 [Polyplax serrata]|uniref:Uncharacterized protein n=1 Tax=Polyplax serrata TaxID=468196 RepID=A0ABR1AMZ5_POLSC